MLSPEVRLSAIQHVSSRVSDGCLALRKMRFHLLDMTDAPTRRLRQAPPSLVPARCGPMTVGVRPLRTFTLSVHQVRYPHQRRIRIVRIVLCALVAVVLRVVRTRLKRARLSKHRCGIHCIDWAEIAQRRFFSTGVIRECLLAVRRTFPYLSGGSLRLRQWLRAKGLRQRSRRRGWRQLLGWRLRRWTFGYCRSRGHYLRDCGAHRRQGFRRRPVVRAHSDCDRNRRRRNSA